MARIDPAAFANHTPARAAAMLLNHFKGDGRASEQKAWDLAKDRRESNDKVGLDFFVNVARVIADGNEEPKVERVSPKRAAYDASGKLVPVEA